MDPYHERLARVGLEAGAQYGFALAGGYAVQANGFVERLSEDVDLFSVFAFADQFETAVSAVIEAYERDGLHVDVTKRFDTFARLYVVDQSAGDAAKVELGLDWRANEPVQMWIGPVLHPDDAAANKVLALFGRALPRDFIDVDAIAESAEYGREDLLRLAAAADAGFDRRMFAGALAVVQSLGDGEFAEYEVTGRQLVDLRARFAQWRAELLN